NEGQKPRCEKGERAPERRAGRGRPDYPFRTPSTRCEKKAIPQGCLERRRRPDWQEIMYASILRETVHRSPFTQEGQAMAATKNKTTAKAPKTGRGPVTVRSQVAGKAVLSIQVVDPRYTVQKVLD